MFDSLRKKSRPFMSHRIHHTHSTLNKEKRNQGDFSYNAGRRQHRYSHGDIHNLHSNQRKNLIENAVISYGIILFDNHRHDTSNITFLLTQKRDTFAFIKFIRGCYDTLDSIYKLFSKMTVGERDRIRNYTFDELWDDTWISKKFLLYTSGYQKAITKYNLIKHVIPVILNSFDNHGRTMIFNNLDSQITDRRYPIVRSATRDGGSNHLLEEDDEELIWEFPKGKKTNDTESGVDCALREFREETGLNPMDIIIHRGYTPVCEIYRGTDEKIYKTYYFVAEAKCALYPRAFEVKKGIRKKTISSEVLDAKWLKYDDILPLISRSKRSILKTVYREIMNSQK